MASLYAGALAAGGLLVVAFTRWELRARAPMLPMRLFASRGFSAGSVVIFFLNASVTGAVFFMAQFQQVSLGQDPLDTGLRLLPWVLLRRVRRAPPQLLSVNVASSEHGPDVSERRPQLLPLSALDVRGRSPTSGDT